MSDATETTMDYSDPDAVAAAVAALAAADPKIFASAVMRDRPLLSAVVALAGSDAMFLEALAGTIRGAGVTRLDADRFRTAVRESVRKAKTAAAGFRLVGDDDDGALQTVREALGDHAPVGPEISVPRGYRMTLTGVTGEIPGRDSVSTVTIAHRPILITGAMRDAASGVQRLRLSWWDDAVQQWRSLAVDRDVAMSRTELTKQARYGLPVNSGNAQHMVKFLSDFEAVNGVITPRLSVSGHLGWQQTASGKPAFLVGPRMIGPDGTATEAGIDPEAVSPEDWSDDLVAFHGNGPGDWQLAAAFAPAGTYEGWREAMLPVAQYERVALAVYASLAAPLLHVLQADPFVVDYCGVTSKGKTTTLGVAASVWGNPDPMAPASAVGTWNATAVFAERRAALCNGVPAILDDTKQRRKDEDIARVIYSMAGGQGRGRGERGDGVRSTATWRTIGLISGEQPAVSFTQDGGTRGRVLTLWGSPFGGNAAADVASLRIRLKQHYGHAGPRFVSHLLANQDRWPEWREAWAEAATAYAQTDPGSTVATRIASYAATIWMAATIAHDIELLPWDWRDPFGAQLWSTLIEEAGEANRAAAAARDMYGWAVSMRHAFDGQLATGNNGQNELPPGTGTGYIGRWKDYENYIGFVPSKATEFLKRLGYDADAVYRAWDDAGWLLASGRKGHERTGMMEVADKKIYGYKITLAGFEEAGALARADDGTP